MRARDNVGDLREVLLVPPHKLAEFHQFAIPNQMDLRIDLAKALRGFTLTQRKVLAKVLVHGMSIEEAARSYKAKSRSWWRNWYLQEALPKMRERLAVYFVDGKVVV